MTSDDEAHDRAAILARRRRLIAAALSGLSGLGCRGPGDARAPEPAAALECGTPTPDDRAGPPALVSEAEPPAEPGCVWPDADLPPLVEPAPEPELAQLTPEQREAQARERYELAATAYQAGDYDEATLEFAAAHRLLPDHPELLYDAAEAAYRGGRLGRARELLRQLQGRGGPPVSAELEAAIADRLAQIDAAACRVAPEPCLKMLVDPEGGASARGRRRRPGTRPRPGSAPGS